MEIQNKRIRIQIKSQEAITVCIGLCLMIELEHEVGITLNLYEMYKKKMIAKSKAKNKQRMRLI